VNTYRAERDILADPATVASIILNIGELADWNPALIATRTNDRVAIVDHPYSVSTRIPGRATLTYVQANADRIVWRLDAGGSVETGEWDLYLRGRATRVVHTMTHGGALFALMQRAMTPVPTWRLDRLQQRAEARASSTGIS